MKTRLTALSFLLVSLAAPAADIVALCIGNNAYQRVEDQLDTPVNDAQLMKATLEALPGGADVTLLKNATKEDIQVALNELKVRAQGAKLALVFYSGHGMDGQPVGFATEDTFLLPVDATITNVNYLDTRAVSLSSVLRALKDAPVTARAVILDCCRTGAPKATEALLGATKNFGNLDERVKAALGKAVVPDATLVAFAASPGRKAAAFLTEADEHSPFTKFLTDELSTGAGNLRDIVEAAAETTETRTGQLQVPYVSYTGAASAIRQIVFRTSPVAARAPAAGSPPAPMVPVVPVLPAQPGNVKAGKATKSAPFVNSLGMKFVPVMSDKEGRKVLFSVWETRRQDYAAYASAVSGVDDTWKTMKYGQHPVGHLDDHPVVGVTWENATACARWLTEVERAAGRIGPRDEYRLPTDVEWSHAVGIAGQEDAAASPKDKDEALREVYPWNGEFPPLNRSGNYADEEARVKGTTYYFVAIEGYQDGHSTTAPVGSYTPNKLGIHDLGGNVSEWCQDWYDVTEAKYRVMRGAGWGNANASDLLSSARYVDQPGSHSAYYGFRLVLVVGG